MRFADGLAEFLFPLNAVCAGCGDVSGAAHDGLCEDCLEAMERLRVTTRGARCPLCMSPLDARHDCGMLPGTVSRASYAFRYEGPAASMVKRFKYSGAANLSGWMARQMLSAPGAAELLNGCDCIVCAPADRFRRSRRGYNQALLLARDIAQAAGVRLDDALHRRPFVRKQSRLDRARRLENLTGVIHCGHPMTGLRILLIDDVRTTGATAAACARALREAGAESVTLLTFAAAERRF